MTVVFIDGRSGSGKTTLAAQLAAELDADTLHVEDLYPGWQGLAAGSAAVATALDTGSYQRYDWVAGRFDEWASVTRGPLIIEGCGAITRANLQAAERWASQVCGEDAPDAVRSLWLDCPDEVRRSRALARDGDTFAPHWQSWAEQEDAHFAQHEPWVLADAVLRSSVGDLQ